MADKAVYAVGLELQIDIVQQRVLGQGERKMVESEHEVGAGFFIETDGAAGGAGAGCGLRARQTDLRAGKYGLLEKV